MIDLEPLVRRWEKGPLAAWAPLLAGQLAAGMSEARHGDIPRWRDALEALPDIQGVEALTDQPTVSVSSSAGIDGPTRETLETALRGLCPWRKGPYELFGVPIDTEWRSDWKWDRLAPHIADLSGRRVLDVGCGNGYHCWRMRGAGAAEVIGIDPSPLFVTQFAALKRYINDDAVCVLPLGIEKLPPKLHAFDSAFSMGVLYHRRSPMEHLQTLRDCLRKDGQLVLETLVIKGTEQHCLTPSGRYARMGNVWFIPSSAMLLIWLAKLGFKNPRIVDESVTTTEEQRSTDWMRFQSLADFLDPNDASRSIEGYPAPRRAILLAEAP